MRRSKPLQLVFPGANIVQEVMNVKIPKSFFLDVDGRMDAPDVIRSVVQSNLHTMLKNILRP
jgi:hypothetical protein